MSTIQPRYLINWSKMKKDLTGILGGSITIIMIRERLQEALIQQNTILDFYCTSLFLYNSLIYKPHLIDFIKLKKFKRSREHIEVIRKQLLNC